MGHIPPQPPKPTSAAKRITAIENRRDHWQQLHNEELNAKRQAMQQLDEAENKIAELEAENAGLLINSNSILKNANQLADRNREVEEWYAEYRDDFDTARKLLRLAYHTVYDDGIARQIKGFLGDKLEGE